MVYHKLKPVFVGEKLRFGTCMLSSSTLKTPGHLRMHYNNGIDYEMYLQHDNWQKRAKEQLTKREKEILILVKQGKSYKNIAKILGKSENTLQNERSSIYEKLDVDNMMQAVNYATHHHLIFGHDKSSKEQKKEVTTKRTRRLMNKDMKRLIQEKLDNGQSVNSIANQVGISESAIRYAFDKGYLKKPPKKFAKNKKTIR